MSIIKKLGLGHIASIIPSLVGKDMKDFVVKVIAKELLLQPTTTPLNISASEFHSNSNASSQKRKNNLKLAGKWCENQEELPFNTRARVYNNFT